jgi:hypothetical protein
MADGRRNNGGARKGAGRKSKAAEDKVSEFMVGALQKFYDEETPDGAKEEFMKKLLEHTQGQLFIGQHIFGKPTEKVDVNSSGAVSISLHELVKFNKPIEE